MAKSSRAKAVDALRSLINFRRPSGSDAPIDIFPFGIIQRTNKLTGTLVPRDPREDRAIVIMTGTVIEQGLETAILARLPGILAGNESYIFGDDAAPLRGLDAKIRIAFALGILGEEARSDLSLIKSIRNTFAHSRLEIDFTTPQVIEACNHFTLPKRWTTYSESDSPDPRELFIHVGFDYAIRLITFDGGPIGEVTHRILGSTPSSSPQTPQ